VSVDLNKVADKLKKRKPLGVNRGGQIMESNPGNDGNRSTGKTTLEPQRFFLG
jgi:hypothetical protein